MVTPSQTIVANTENKQEKPLRREKIVGEFSPKKEHPITREQQQKRKEHEKDEKEMAQQEPIAKRTQRKEEEALGKTHDHQTFTDRLVELSDKPDRILLKMYTKFPFDLFPDKITIDPLRIQIIRRIFFLSQKIQNILIKDILETYIEEAPIMATLVIVTSDDKDHPIRISRLDKTHAEKAMKIIQGLVIARSESPDIAKVESIR